MIPEEFPPQSGASESAPSPERRFLLWTAMVFGVNVLCILMLAARESSPLNLRSYYDIAIFICLVGGASFVVIRLMFFYPYRLLDLVVIVLVLSIGMKFAIDAGRGIGRLDWYHSIFGRAPGANELPRDGSETPSAVVLAEFCVLMGCVLLSGAALGLRHCRLLKIDAPLKRSIVLAFGMAALPAAIALFAIPLYLLNRVLGNRASGGDGYGWAAALVLSFAATLVNAILALKTIVLRTEISAQEQAWHGPPK